MIEQHATNSATAAPLSDGGGAARDGHLDEGEPRGPAATLGVIRARLRTGLAHGRADDLPKHARMRRTILDGIASGALAHGDRLPSEQQLAREFRVSVGTARRALGQLVTEGVVVREQGRGTFVADAPRPFFRFVDARGGAILPVSSHILDRSRTDARGAWSDALGEDSSGWVRIRRLVHVGGQFNCYSEFYVGASRFGGMLDHPIGEDARLKKILGDAFHATIVRVAQSVAAQRFGHDLCELIGQRRGTFGLVVDATSFDAHDEPVCFQRNWIPASDHRLELSPAGRANEGAAN